VQRPCCQGETVLSRCRHRWRARSGWARTSSSASTSAPFCTRCSAATRKLPYVAYFSGVVPCVPDVLGDYNTGGAAAIRLWVAARRRSRALVGVD
jgi:hypothetical protein